MQPKLTAPIVLPQSVTPGENETALPELGADGPKRRPFPWLGITVGVLALACAGLWYVQAQRPAPTSYVTSSVDRGPVISKVTASGTLSARVTVQLGAQVSGRIQALFVDFNSAVHRGQVLARIDPELFDAALAQSLASDASARAGRAKAKFQAADMDLAYRRLLPLVAAHFIARQDIDTARANALVAHAQVDASQAAVAQADAALHQAQVNLTYTTIASPIDGVVISRNVDVGQTVAASLQAPTLFVLAGDLRKVQVDTSVAEADVGRLRAGLDAEFQVDAYPGNRFKGRVRQIRNAPQVVQNVVTYDAVIDVGNPDLRLKPGMTANVSFIDAQRPKALRVPNAALRFQPTGVSAAPGSKAVGWRSVWVLDGTKPSERELKTGLTDGRFTEVLKGDLKPGDAVITDERGGASGAPPAKPGRNPARGMF